ncbi:MAG TPA: archaellin/type IV pilin N-terminal domain-containing protein [Candidatus Nanoarchaeia archaeon]|nr:archaellin/type IV pilin N-terminal domain-containing protein [Candidatus Nanoarchaeia archaeon]
MEKKMEKKKGVSPVIATVLLIAMVVVIALIIFLWFRGLTKEAITKFDGQNIELVCMDVSFEASYSSGVLYIANLGNVPIFGMKMKILSDGSYQTVDLSSGWPTSGLNQGATYSGDVSSQVSGGNKLVLIPVLIGDSKSGQRTFMCSEKQVGYQLDI